MSERRVHASLIIKSDDLQAEYIAEMMKPLPGSTQSKGKPVFSRPNASLARHSSWMLSTEHASTGLDEHSPISEHIGWLPGLLDGKQQVIDELANNCDVEISCFVSTASTNFWFDVPHGIVKKLAEQKIDLVFDAYAY